MKVILIQNIPNLGKFGDIKDVADGYARNYLIPKKLVLPYNEQNLQRVKELTKNIELKQERERRFVSEIKHKLEKVSITVNANVGKDGKLYGSVTKEDIVNAIEEQLGIKIDKHNINLEQPIKEVGVYNVNITIASKKFPEIKDVAYTKIWVVGR